MTETAPCPWCKDKGKPFLYLSRTPFLSYAMQCNACFARGPHVTFEPSNHRKTWEEVVTPAKVEATERWNELYEILSRGDSDEKSSENREGDEPPDTALAAVS